MGRLIRFDASALSQHVAKNSLKPERAPMPSRYQRGSVKQRGKSKVWYGYFREDVRTPDGEITRVPRHVKLGTHAELPTKAAARNKLAEIMSVQEKQPVVTDITFSELVERWQAAEGPTYKASTFLHYVNALNTYVMPEFGACKIAKINRADIQTWLNKRAATYSKSTLRTMKVALGITLGWAEACEWIDKNPCARIKLPQKTGGRRVKRTRLTPAQIEAIAGKLQEPYATLVLLLHDTGLRISEAIALKWADLNDNVLSITRRIYDRKVDELKSKRSRRKLTLNALMVARIKALHWQFANSEWMFQSEAGTPVDPHNALARYYRPAAAACGITVSGWHDFRHTLSTNLRRQKQHPKVVSDILGHSKVNLAMDVYDEADLDDISTALASVALNQLQPSATKSNASA
jgi:integrase